MAEKLGEFEMAVKLSGLERTMERFLARMAFAGSIESAEQAAADAYEQIQAARRKAFRSIAA